jgi:hypothetical protein
MCDASKPWETPENEAFRILRDCIDVCVTDEVNCHEDCTACGMNFENSDDPECTPGCLSACSGCSCCMCGETKEEEAWKSLVCTTASNWAFLDG